MRKVQAKLHTSGDGYWSNKAKAVSVTAINLTYTNDELDFGELRVYFNTQTWDVRKDGLIYTDSDFLTDLRYLLTEMGYDASDVDYSEQGMQGDNYVSCDVGELFINTFMQAA
jgi:hypothetical protein